VVWWLTEKVADDFPAGILTEMGVLAADVSELLTKTTDPPTGAGPLSVTVPTTLVEAPPVTVDGETEMLAKAGALTDIEAVRDTVSRLAVMMAEVLAPTAVVLIVNLAVSEPIGIDTTAGTAADFDEDASLIDTAPRFGAALSVIVPLDVPPPLTEFGDT